MTFYVKRLPDGRVYMSQIAPTDSEEVLSEVDADTWIAGREKLRPSGIETYVHRFGYGYV